MFLHPISVLKYHFNIIAVICMLAEMVELLCIFYGLALGRGKIVLQLSIVLSVRQMIGKTCYR